MANITDKYLTTKQVLAYLGVSRKTLYRWIAEPPAKSTFNPNRVKQVRLGGTRLWERESFFRELELTQ